MPPTQLHGCGFESTVSGHADFLGSQVYVHVGRLDASAMLGALSGALSAFGMEAAFWQHDVHSDEGLLLTAAMNIHVFHSLLELLHDGHQAFSIEYFHRVEESRSAFACRYVLPQLFRGRATYLLDCSKRGRHGIQHLLASATGRILSDATQVSAG